MQSLISSCALHIHKLVSLHHISASDIGAALLMHYQNKMQIRMSVLLCIAAAFTLPAELHAQSAAVSTSANVTGSLGYLCSSQAGILTALQHVAANSDTANLNVSIPANLSNAAAVQQVAQVRSTNLHQALRGPQYALARLVVLCNAVNGGQRVQLSS